MNSQDSLSPTPSQSAPFGACYELDDHRNQEENPPVIGNFYGKSALSSHDIGCSCSAQNNRASSTSPLRSTAFRGLKHSKAKSETFNFDFVMNRSRSHDHQNYLSKNAYKSEHEIPAQPKSFHSRAASLIKFALPSKTSLSTTKSDTRADTAADVCFPAPDQRKKSCVVDFSELRRFAATDKANDHSSRNYYKPAIFFASTHRPLVPQAMVLDPTLDCPDYMMRDGISPTEKRLSRESSSSGSWSDPYDLSKSSRSISNGFGNHRRNSFTMDRFSFFTTDAENTIYAPDISSLLEEGSTFEDLFDSPNRTWWLDCLDPTDDEIETLSKAFGIHPLTAEDIRTKEARQKVELFKKYYFVSFHTFESDSEANNFLDPINMYLVIFREGILSFHFSPIQHPGNVRQRIRQLRDYVRVSSDWICYAIIDDITDGFIPIIREIEVETDGIEDSVFVAREADFGPMIRRIGDARQKVMILLRLLSGKADVIKMFAKRCTEQTDNAPRAEISLYLGDIQDHIITMHQNLSVYEKIFSRSHGNYLAQLQVESVNSNNRVTKVLGRVTLVGTILVPLNLVTGLFGMNVRVPGQGGEDLKWFFGIIGFIVAIVMLFSLVANKWLGEAEAGDNERAPPSRSITSRIRNGITRRPRSIRAQGY